MFFFFFWIKPFVDLSTFALKSEHVRILQDFIVWPKYPKTEKSRTRIDQQVFKNKKSISRNATHHQS